jgi:thiol-disulfide isomerase/thioredoxin
MVAVNRRLLVGSMALAVVIAVGLGWAVSRDGSDDGDEVTMSSPGVVQDQTIGTNAQVEGDPLPAVTLPDVDGNEVALTSLVGEPLIVNFWYSGCVPCKKEMPLLGATAAELDGKVRFVGVNTLDDADRAADFAAEHDAAYLQLLDRNGELASATGVRVQPTTLFIDANGRIVSQKSGELTEDKLDAAIAEAFPELD